MADGDYSSRPSSARIYDALLGGNHNFAADRQAADEVIAVLPQVCDIARANRAFLGRAVRYLLNQGIRQFLDIGSGISTIGSVHEIVAAAQPAARVVYVDQDPVAVAHSINILRENPNATALRADLCFPEAILTHHNVRTMLDLSQPVGLLMISVLHFVADQDAYPAVAKLRDALAPGSYLALSHPVAGSLDQEAVTATARIYRRSTTPTGILRTRDQITKFIDDLEPVPPGLAGVSRWQPGTSTDAHDDHAVMIAGVAQKPRQPGP